MCAASARADHRHHLRLQQDCIQATAPLRHLADVAFCTADSKQQTGQLGKYGLVCMLKTIVILTYSEAQRGAFQWLIS
jgi:hypothetical protein